MGRTLPLIFFVMLLTPLILAQRGGGGGGSSGGGGSRSSSNLFRTRYYGNCQTTCMGNPGCLQDCKIHQTAAWATLGSMGLCGCCIGAFSCAACCKRRKKYNELKQELNIVDTNSMPLEQFRRKRDRIIDLINMSANNYNFALEQLNEKTQMKAHATIQNEEENYCTEIKLVGSDKFGSWQAKGFILCKEGSMFFWMYKEYDNQTAAGQTGDYEHLVYKSTSFNDRFGMEGVWAYLGFQYTTQYCGKWKLWQPGM